MSLVEGGLLRPGGYRELTTEVLLKNGAGTGYALGLDVTIESQWRLLAHEGEVSGFVAANRVYPEERAAVVVLSNQDASKAATTLAQKIAELLFVAASPGDAEKLAEVRSIFAGLPRGTIERSLLSPNGNAYFSPRALANFKAGLGRLGAPKQVEQKRQGLRGGLVTRVYRVRLAKQTLEIVTRALPHGRFEQYQVGVE